MTDKMATSIIGDILNEVFPHFLNVFWARCNQNSTACSKNYQIKLSENPGVLWAIKEALRKFIACECKKSHNCKHDILIDENFNEKVKMLIKYYRYINKSL